MAEFSSYPAGCPCWVDLMSPDVDAATAFYSDVFGWEAKPEFDDDGNRIYTQFLLGDKVVAGLGGTMPGMEGMPAIWNTYICVDDASETATAVEKAGGTVMMPAMPVMDAGHMAIVSDPSGAVVSLWQPNEHVGAGLANQANTWSWNELVTRDLDSCRSFYSEVFGWEYDGQDMPMGVYEVIKGGETGWGGLMAMPPGMPEQVPNHWAVYFMVDNADETAKKVTAAGGQMVQEPTELPGVGRMAVAHDPHGGSFSLLEPAPQD